jgi:hypothetical protein
MWIRLTRKLADFLDGVDVSHRHAGDVFELPMCDAHLLIAEGWAERYIPVRQPGDLEHGQSDTKDSVATDPSQADALERLRRLREQPNRRHLVDVESRRVEDRIREELRDERAITITPNKAPAPDSGE